MGAGRKVVIGLGVFVGLVLLLLILVPIAFGGRIAGRAKAEIEKRVDARVDWSGARLTFFRHFPDLTLSLNDLSVRGIGEFEGDTLASVSSFRLVLDVGSVLFGDQTVIRQVDVDEPAVHLIVLEDGAANWDIARASEGASGAEESGGLNLELRGLAVNRGRIVFENRGTGMMATIEGLDHSLAGDFSRDRFTIDTHTRAASVTAGTERLSYLSGVEAELDAAIDADMTTRRFTLGDNRLRLNALGLSFTGTVQSLDDALALDLEFASPDNDFAGLLSLVPAIWTNDFESLRTEGELSVAGRVGGRYGENAFPSFQLTAQVDGASLQYPDMPLAARDIALDLAVDNPGGSADSTVVRMRRLHARIGDDPVEATMTVRSPVSDPDFDVAVDGTVDLGAASRTFKLETVEELAGIVNADFEIRARRSALAAKQYDRVAARGDIVASNVVLRSTAVRQPVSIEELSLGLSPRVAELRTFRGTVGSSDIRLRGTLENLLGFALGEGALAGNAVLESDRFDLDEWRSDDSELDVIPVPPRLDFVLRTTIAQLHHDRLDMTDARGLVRVKDERLTIDSLRLNAIGGELRLAGYYDTTDPAQPTFDVDVSIVDADLAQAFEALTTVRLLAPVARYAQGRFSTDLSLAGPLGENMAPLLTALSGRGALRTSQIELRDFPPMNRLAEALNSTRLQNPALRAISTVIQIRDGRLHVRPFDVAVGATTLTVGGSNGIDRSLEYDLVLALPQSSIESGVRQAIGNLFARAGAATSLDSASVVRVAVRLTGTIDDPSISLGVGQGVDSALQSLEQTARGAVQQATGEAAERVDSASVAARRRAEAEAQRIIADAEGRAATIRAEADSLAAVVRRQADRQADSLVARASSPLAKVAAERAAATLRREADQRATQITEEADRRANGVVEEARRQADALVRGAGGQPDTTRADTTAAGGAIPEPAVGSLPVTRADGDRRDPLPQNALPVDQSAVVESDARSAESVTKR